MAQFSDPQLAVLAVLCIATVGAVIAARRRSGGATNVVAWLLAAVILAAWAGAVGRVAQP